MNFSLQFRNGIRTLYLFTTVNQTIYKSRTLIPSNGKTKSGLLLVFQIGSLSHWSTNWMSVSTIWAEGFTKFTFRRDWTKVRVTCSWSRTEKDLYFYLGYYLFWTTGVFAEQPTSSQNFYFPAYRTKKS